MARRRLHSGVPERESGERIPPLLFVCHDRSRFPRPPGESTPYLSQLTVFLDYLSGLALTFIPRCCQGSRFQICDSRRTMPRFGASEVIAISDSLELIETLFRTPSGLRSGHEPPRAVRESLLGPCDAIESFPPHSLVFLDRFFGIPSRGKEGSVMIRAFQLHPMHLAFAAFLAVMAAVCPRGSLKKRPGHHRRPRRGPGWRGGCGRKGDGAQPGHGEPERTYDQLQRGLRCPRA